MGLGRDVEVATIGHSTMTADALEIGVADNVLGLEHGIRACGGAKDAKSGLVATA